jgi:hypothetical protein
MMQPSMAHVEDIVELLRAGDLPNTTLRQLLQKRLPCQHMSMDDQFLRNFKHRCRLFALDPKRKWKSDEIELLWKGEGLLPADGCTIFDSDIVLANFKEHLRNTLQDTGDIWDVINFLDRCEIVDFRVSYCKTTSRPNGIVWMTTDMKKLLRRHGHLLFLDYQKRQFNKVNWPYFGPVAIDGDFKIGVVAESLFITESLDGYYFALKSMFDMCPQFRKEDIKLVYSDEFLTEELLSRLGIQDTCQLRGDHWHLENEVWPKYLKANWEAVKPYLKAMIAANTKEACDQAFESAITIPAIARQPHLVEYIAKFRGNPEKYCN